MSTREQTGSPATLNQRFGGRSRNRRVRFMAQMALGVYAPIEASITVPGIGGHNEVSQKRDMALQPARAAEPDDMHQQTVSASPHGDLGQPSYFLTAPGRRSRDVARLRTSLSPSAN